jgi:hypothetical protein
MKLPAKLVRFGGCLLNNTARFTSMWVGGWLALNAATAARAQVTVSFEAQNLVHISYDVTRTIQSPDMLVAPLRLYATPEGGSAQLVATAPGGNPSRVAGQARITGVAPGKSVFFTLTYSTRDFGSQSESVGGWFLDSRGVVGGTPLFDESLTALPVKPQFVTLTVPAGRSVELKAVEVLDNVTLLTGAGTVTLRGVRAQGLNVDFVGEQVLGELTMEGCVFASGAVARTSGDLDVRDTFFGQGVSLRAGGALSLQSCDFYDASQLGAYARLQGPKSGFSVSGCVFINQAILSVTGLTPGPLAGVTGNSFLGGIALEDDGGAPPAGVTIPGNYWGGTLGPQKRSRRWLDGQGGPAGMENPNFTFLASGVERATAHDVTIPPSTIGIWDHKVVQNVSSGLVRKGREILVAVDARTRYGTRDASAMRLKVGPLLIAPVSAGTIRRDYGPPTADLGSQTRTVNFIIPGRDEHIFDWEIVDTDPPGGGGPVRLVAGQIVQREKPERPLRVAVLPLVIDGYAKDFQLNGTGHRAATSLKRHLMSMLPLRPDELEIDVLADARYKLGYSALYVLASRGYMLNECSAVLRGHLTTLNASRSRPYDFLVAVVPRGTLGADVLGASLAFRREVILVDEISPESAIHEMGHALGLYTTVEQYTVLWDGYDDSETYYKSGYGARLEGCTAFIPGDSPAVPPINGRIRHFPFGIDSNTWDVMGGDGAQWIMPATHQSFGEALLSMLSVPDPLPAPQPRERAADGFRRLVFEGLLSPEMSPYGHFPLLRESIHCGPAPADMGVIQQGWPGGHEFTAFDAAGRQVFSATVQRRQQGGMLQPWVQTFDVPEEAVRYEIRDGWTREVIFIQKPGALPTPVIQPPALSSDGERVMVSWSLGSGLPSGRPLDAALSVSENGGATWRMLGNYDEVTAVALPRDGFGNGALTFRLVVSDGINQADANTAAWQPPPLQSSTVTLLQPWDGARAPVGTAWNLEAAFDVDWPGQTMSWASSRDGVLGAGPSLTGVVLSPGIHTLSATSQAPGRAPRQKQVTVMVANLTTADLAVAPDALSLAAAGVDPIQGDATQPLLGRNCQIRVRVRNPGRTHTARLQLFLTQPQGTESLLGDTIFEWHPLGQREQAAEFVPTGSGSYRVRAVLSVAGSDGVTDPNLLNNEQVWTLFNQPPEARGYAGTTRDGQTLAIELTAEDPELDPVSFTVVTPPGHGTLSGTPPALRYQPQSGFTGMDQFTFRASDAFGTGRTATATLRVVPAPPVFLSPLAVTGEQYHPFSYTAHIGGSSPTLSVTVPSLLGGLTFAPETRTVAGTVGVVGTYGLAFAVENAAGRVEPSVQVTFAANNDPPALTSARVVEGIVGQPIAYQPSGTYAPTSFDYLDLPPGVFAAANGGLTGMPAKSGAFSVRLGLTNAAGTAWEVIVLRIASNRQPPGVPIQSVYGTVGTPLTWPLQAFNEPTRFRLADLPVGLTMDPATGVISGVPLQAGSFPVSLEASNLYGADSDLVWFNIEAPAGYPVMADPGPLTLAGGVTADVLVSASGGPVEFAATGLPAGLALDTTTGRLTGAPTEWGEFSPVIRVTNALGTTASRLRLTVTPGTGMPVMTHAPVINGSLGGSVSFQLAGTNAPAFSVRGLPDGLSYEPATRRITGVWRVAGTRFIEVTASNAKGQNTQRLMLQSTATFAGWLSLHGLTGASALATADPDLDGAPNLAEYLANSDPGAQDSRPMFTIVPEGPWGTLRFRCRPAESGTMNDAFLAGGVAVVLEQATAASPLEWTADPGMFGMGSTTEQDDGTVEVSLPVLGRLPSGANLFRLRASLP